MLSFFKKSSKEDKLYKQYERLLKESHRLSTSSRVESDIKYAEAQAILVEIDNLEKK